jgi:signal transduction histidine kinase
MNLERDLPAVHGFGGELNQVWSNLIDNAVDAVDEGGQIEITAGRERDRVVVRVIDNGCGVPVEVRDRIFDPFFTTKPVGKGTGLGLDIVRRLLQRHNGQIELESRPGRTEFRVTLPISEPN